MSTDKQKRRRLRFVYRGKQLIKKNLHQQLDEIVDPIMSDLLQWQLAGGGIRVVVETALPPGSPDATVQQDEPLIAVPKIEVISR